MSKCDFCQREVMGFAILGIMPTDRVEGRKSARVCLKCMDSCPCARKGDWCDGKLTCPHGYVFELDYQWNEDRVELIFNLLKRKWWSYFVISNVEHQEKSIVKVI
jgi:hypothetical protein